MGVHQGVGVLPGRYAGAAVVIHDGPTPQQLAVAADRRAAEMLAGRICAAAALSATAQCQLLELIGEFDAVDAVRWWADVKSLAHWLGWTCSMSPGVAREHVRVAKALRRMPIVLDAFRAGRLSYSKVREVTQTVDGLDEARLCAMALTATASQLARVISGYRAADGTRIKQQQKRAVSWHTREDGMVDFRASLPAEEAAVLIAAVTSAKDQFGAPAVDPTPVDGPMPGYSSADALLDVARVFLDAAPGDRSGEDRTLVVVHVAADGLAGSSGGIAPAGTSPLEAVIDDVSDRGLRNVPAGTFSGSTGAEPIGHIEGVGPIETETARRLACDSALIGAVVDASGDVLALGRTRRLVSRARRLVSRAQRRALLIRDGMCRFPGCAQSRHLKAHHVLPWSRGGPTDLDNLILLCQWHHTAVHEGGISIERAAGARVGWSFGMPDGSPVEAWRSDQGLTRLLGAQLDRQREQHQLALAAVTGFDDDDARTIRPGWAGERFDLHACVQALFGMKLPDAEQEAA